MKLKSINFFIFLVIVSLVFYFNNALDVIINIQVTTSFTTRLDRFKSMNPYILCAVVFGICFLVNSPNYLLITMSTNDQVTQALSSLASIMKFKGLCLRNPIYLTPYGTAITLFGFAVKELLTICLEIVSSLNSILCMKSYYNQYRVLTLENPNQTTLARISKSEKMQTLMGLTLTALSVCIHMFEFCVVLIIFFFYANIVFYFEFTMLIYVFIAFKQLINFPLFFMFNKKFRAVFHSNETTSAPISEAVVQEPSLNKPS